MATTLRQLWRGRAAADRLDVAAERERAGGARDEQRDTPAEGLAADLAGAGEADEDREAGVEVVAPAHALGAEERVGVGGQHRAPGARPAQGGDVLLRPARGVERRERDLPAEA